MMRQERFIIQNICFSLHYSITEDLSSQSIQWSGAISAQSILHLFFNLQNNISNDSNSNEDNDNNILHNYVQTTINVSEEAQVVIKGN